MYQLKPKIRLRSTTGKRRHIESLLRRHGLHTVCDYALCPNRGECYDRGELTFLLLAPHCTRKCGFCRISTREVPATIDHDEPEKIAAMVKELGFEYVVLTSTTRDDLVDQGAGQFSRTVALLNAGGIKSEVLIPDFSGQQDCFALIAAAKPAVVAHNLETVPGRYGSFRQGSDFLRSLALLAWFRRQRPRIAVKTAIMVGTGETIDELNQLFKQLEETGIDILIIGQYLQPTKTNPAVSKYYSPEEFTALAETAREAGIPLVVAEPLARASHRAAEVYRQYQDMLMVQAAESC